MMLHLCGVIALSCFCAATPAAALTDTRTGIFNEHVKSLQVQLDGNQLAPPVMLLGSDDRILISFDHLSDDREFLRYRLVHCDRNWQPSQLLDTEYLDGFNEGVINDYDFSRSTIVHYTHYGFAIPNQDVSPKLSGNYLVEIYPEDNPDDTWLQCRFMVSEQSAAISAEVSSRTDVDFNDTHQQLSISVDTEHAQVEDIFNDLSVVVSQNGRLDNEVTVSRPLLIAGKTAVYEHLSDLIFDAGNEYRRMEVSSTRYPGMHVDRISLAKPYYHFALIPDGVRADEPYLYDQTQHGRFFIREYDSDDSDLEADYVVVHFSLDADRLAPGASIFLDGDFVSRRFSPESIMTFNNATGRYERAMLLKQGAYNYQYLYVPSGSERGFTANIEGNKYQTVNEYLIKVYHRRRGERYDRLIATGAVFSGK
ncbi:MAG: DUF5103 domain-containing protein [Muribaculaceae bacterium]